MPKPPSIWSRDFALLWQGAVVSALGGQAYEVALVLWTKQATGSGAMVGAVLFTAGITSLLMPIGGVLADRFPRVRLLVVLDAFSGLCVLSLATLFFLLPDRHPALVPAVLVVSFLRSLGMSLFHPVTAALVPDLVPPESLNSANSALESAMRCTIVVGKSMGGLLFRLLGTPMLLLLDGVSFLISALSETFIREPAREDPHAAPRTLNVWRDLRDGFRYTGRVRGFRLYLFEASFANFCIAGLFVSLPFYVEDVLHASEDWYGYLLAAMGLGAMLGGLTARRFPTPGVPRGSIQIFCMGLLNACMLPLSFARTPWAALAILFVAWSCVGFHGVLLTTLVQRRTPREVRGRIFGLLSMIRIGLTPLGMAVFGVLIDHPSAGPTRILFWTGIAGLVTLTMATLFPAFRWFFMGDEVEVGIQAGGPG